VSMLHIDDAIAEHLAHPAMSGADPLTDSLFMQLEAGAAEGALQPLPYLASQPQPEPEHPGWWLLSGALLATLAGLCITYWRA